eukprot:scaffold16900_cov105-Isochrysis_galbana.AAC.7
MGEGRGSVRTAGGQRSPAMSPLPIEIALPSRAIVGVVLLGSFIFSELFLMKMATPPRGSWWLSCVTKAVHPLCFAILATRSWVPLRSSGSSVLGGRLF